MNRFRVHLNVRDLDSSVSFYSELFGSSPTVRKHDYAKWMLEDPRVSFAISNTGRAAGIDHLGIQVGSAAELARLGRRLTAAGGTVTPEADAVCCYAQSDKNWTEDPQGTRWETFHTHGEATSYYATEAACSSEGARTPASAAASIPEPAESCCAPRQGCC